MVILMHAVSSSSDIPGRWIPFTIGFTNLMSTGFVAFALGKRAFACPFAHKTGMNLLGLAHRSVLQLRKFAYDILLM